ncbi:hypothetical protein CPB83DRAFT_140729 [Crepidotus variabilis]|uniref:Uncharacterized protein n=1 Tax=Crepidotus variabilis TaxID=179855 RepID=A0A9P6JIG0_9AGAR|nr:hypothetical protein CPB83DRAFT_140729 [Crepidotus variabilis]
MTASSAQILANKTSSGDFKFQIIAPKNCGSLFSVKVQIEDTEIQPMSEINARRRNSDEKTTSVGTYKCHGTDDLQTYKITLLPKIRDLPIFVYQLQFAGEEESSVYPTTSSEVSTITVAQTEVFSSRTSTPSPSSSSGLAGNTSSTLHTVAHSSRTLAIGLGTSLPLLLIAILVCFFLYRKSRRKIEFNPSDMAVVPSTQAPSHPRNKTDTYSSLDLFSLHSLNRGANSRHPSVLKVQEILHR